MRFGIVGLGRMGGNLARAAMERGHEVVGYSREAEATEEAPEQEKEAEEVPA